MSVATPFPSVEEITKHEAFPTVTWQLEPHQSGYLPVAVNRGGPFNIHWEVHGDGPIKVVLLCGLGFFKTSYQRQTVHFGHKHGSKYSVLILDNRGMGRSDQPVMRYSTSAMAADAIEVLDHLGWNEERQLHVVGLSMGGMIAQELAQAIPTRLASLNLICTAGAIENTVGFLENLRNRATMLLPKSLDRTVQYAAGAIFPAAWLGGPDDADVPDPRRVPRCRMAPGFPDAYPRFATNYERFAAQEVTKQRDPGYTKAGFLLQAVAAGWHHQTPAQLGALADAVGRERILVMHGTDDAIISVPHGRKLIEALRPAEGLVVEGMGHGPIHERTRWFNDVLEKRIAVGEELSGRGGT
ncbi:Alpha/Beta hydrolase protein [Xylariomycetidae sp. FL0641]|nr:Alpha/Beta hydrolase protein [Xylariomycetidae sp. FL0641]